MNVKKDCQRLKKPKESTLDIRTNSANCQEVVKPKISGRNLTKNFKKLLKETRDSITIISVKAVKMERDMEKQEMFSKSSLNFKDRWRMLKIVYNINLKDICPQNQISPPVIIKLEV